MRLNSYFENCNIFCKEQYGFRKKKSTGDAVNELLNNIYNATNRKEHFGAIFLDLSKAFDTVPHNVLLLKLEHYGIRGTPLKLLKSYLSNRHQFVTVSGHKSQTKEVSIGVPQGSVLGPLLFLIYINDLPQSTKNMKSILFADDTTLFTSHRDIHTLSKNMSDDLTMVKEWLIANCLTLNINKTYYMLFTTRSVPDDIRVMNGEQTLERRLSGKFLGVTLDDKLTFKEHINAVKTKLSRFVENANKPDISRELVHHRPNPPDPNPGLNIDQQETGWIMTINDRGQVVRRSRIEICKSFDYPFDVCIYSTPL